MKANPNLIAAIWFIIVIVVLSFAYQSRTQSIRAECAQTIVTKGFPAVEAAKACN